jgi:molybdopterin converting factor small subunit
MKVRVLFFGATADVVGKRGVTLSLAGDGTTGDAFNAVLAEYPRLQDHKLLFSVNQEFASGFEIVHDGDELAVFTAVSGG